MDSKPDNKEPLLSQVGDTQGQKILSLMGSALTREVQGYNLNAAKALTMNEVVPKEISSDSLKGNVMTQEDIQAYLQGEFIQAPA